jgi:predicted PurR-regulated permease PerM
LKPITASIRRYMGLKTAVSLLTGFLVWISLTLLHVDFAALLGILAFVLNYIPNIGSIIASVPAVLLALVQHGVGTSLIVLCVYLAVNVGIGNLLEPRIMGHGLGLSPLAVIASLIFWGWVFGGAGMLLAVPLTRIVKIILESSDETRWVAVLLSTGRPAGPPAARSASIET